MRRLTVECKDGHKEEIVIGSHKKIPNCICKKKREILWDQKGTQGAPAFRVRGLTKNFK